ncbi:thioredoxin domain-containing protein, partial [Candidatus Bathyarchaeota archaeon]|nr:thioredoxin domain-containing protein [Candidatus Bathyarchaeota archaeon]
MVSGEKGNRLVNERSPYLLQHAYNPVDWYPWGEEAFTDAAAGDKPIFLSVGYSTCHWCHVMERECFTDPEVAALMNEAFINVKVDREERPDVDGVYMAVSQMMTGGGGWPLTIIMTPDGKPFFAGTYIPRVSRPGAVGMLDLVPRIRDYWVNQRGRLEEIGESVVEGLNTGAVSGPEELGVETLDTAYRLMRLRYDEEHGGFGDAPKFP